MARFEVAPRDDRSSKNEPNRAGNDRDTTVLQKLADVSPLFCPAQACARRLSATCDVAVFERAPRVGFASMSVTMGGGAVDVPLRMIGQGYYEHLEDLCRRVGVPTTKATVDCSFRLGDGTTLRYSTSRWRNALEVVARWRDAWALDGALRTAGAGGTWADWRRAAGLTDANPFLLALDAQLSWVLSCTQSVLDTFPAASVLAYVRRLDLSLGAAVTAGKRDVVRVSPSVAALEAALCHGSALRLGRAVDGLDGSRTIDGLAYDAVVVATPPGAVAKALRFEQVFGDGTPNPFDAFETETNAISLHADPALMPPSKRDWRALNVTQSRSPNDAAQLTVWRGNPGQDEKGRFEATST